MVSVEGAEKNREGGERERERGKKEWREREKENKDFADTVTAAENRRSRKANNVNSSLSCVQRQDWHPSPKTNRLGENSFCFCIWFGAPTDWMRPTHSGGGWQSVTSSTKLISSRHTQKNGDPHIWMPAAQWSWHMKSITPASDRKLLGCPPEGISLNKLWDSQTI